MDENNVKPLDNVVNNTQTVGSLPSNIEMNFGDTPVAESVPPKKRISRVGIFIGIGCILLLTSIAYCLYLFYPPFEQVVNKVLNINQNVETVKYKVPFTSKIPVSVFINNKDYGKTPLEVELEEGTYNVVFKLEGYKDKSFEFKVGKDSNYSLLQGVELSLIDPYEGWLTYRNEKYGFGFKYPNDWKVSEAKNSAGNIVVTLVDGELKYSAVYSFVGQDNYRNEPLRNYEEGKVTDVLKSNLTIGKQREIKVYSLSNKSDSSQTLVDNFVGRYVFDNNKEYEEYKDKANLDKWLESMYCYTVDLGIDFDNLDKQYSQNKFNKAAPSPSDSNSVVYKTDAYYKLDLPTGKSVKLTNSGNNFNQKAVVDKLGKIIVYVDHENIMYANNMSLSSEVQLFRGYSNSEIGMTFTPIGISNDSRFLAYSVFIFKNEGCNSFECDVETIKAKFGWETALYVYDLKGVYGNQLIATVPDNEYGYPGLVSELNWSNNSKALYYTLNNTRVINEYTLNSSGKYAKKASYSLNVDGLYNYSFKSLNPGTGIISVETYIDDVRDAYTANFKLENGVVSILAPLSKDLGYMYEIDFDYTRSKLLDKEGLFIYDTVFSSGEEPSELPNTGNISGNCDYRNKNGVGNYVVYSCYRDNKYHMYIYDLRNMKMIKAIENISTYFWVIDSIGV